MAKTFNRIVFVLIIVLIVYLNNKLNNLIGMGYFGCIKYFFIGLSILFVVYPNFEKDYKNFKNNHM
tara:strand:- start:10 stop:207 length:198 start_codon:yes stop_codon:yes gene_type:complete